MILIRKKYNTGRYWFVTVGKALRDLRDNFFKMIIKYIYVLNESIVKFDKKKEEENMQFAAHEHFILPTVSEKIL